MDIQTLREMIDILKETVDSYNRKMVYERLTDLLDQDDLEALKGEDYLLDRYIKDDFGDEDDESDYD